MRLRHEYHQRHVEGGDEVCAAVESGERIEAVELAERANAGLAFIAPGYLIKSSGNVDIDNDGLDENVIELSYESGAGQGCTFNYFELLAEDRKSLLNNSNSKPVRELQGIADEGYRGRNCGNIENRLFKFDNKIYYETNAANNRQRAARGAHARRQSGCDAVYVRARGHDEGEDAVLTLMSLSLRRKPTADNHLAGLRAALWQRQG